MCERVRADEGCIDTLGADSLSEAAVCLCFGWMHLVRGRGVTCLQIATPKSLQTLGNGHPWNSMKLKASGVVLSRVLW